MSNACLCTRPVGTDRATLHPCHATAVGVVQHGPDAVAVCEEHAAEARAHGERVWSLPGGVGV